MKTEFPSVLELETSMARQVADTGTIRIPDFTGPNGEIQMQVIDSDHDPDCWPAVHLNTILVDKIHSRRIRKLWLEERKQHEGNCAEMSMLIMRLLHMHGLGRGWRIVTANAVRTGAFHVWLEYGEWQVDFGNGFALIMPVRSDLVRWRNVRRYTGPEFARHLRTVMK